MVRHMMSPHRPGCAEPSSDSTRRSVGKQEKGIAPPQLTSRLWYLTDALTKRPNPGPQCTLHQKGRLGLEGRMDAALHFLASWETPYFSRRERAALHSLAQGALHFDPSTLFAAVLKRSPSMHIFSTLAYIQTYSLHHASADTASNMLRHDFQPSRGLCMLNSAARSSTLADQPHLRFLAQAVGKPDAVLNLRPPC